MKIKMIVHPHAYELQQAHLDQAHITNQPLVEKPFWYENTETGQTYYDLQGCVGWPTEVSEKDEGRPGYVAIVGIVKSKKQENPENAVFQLLAEMESKDVPTLMNKMIALRADYGFGLHPNLFETWFGDPERCVTMLAIKNERLTASGDDRQAILITPPDDFYEPTRFDEYVRSMRSCIMPDNPRFYMGHNKILKNRLRKFLRDDPAVTAVGGLVHSLLRRCAWLDQTSENAFVIEEGI